MPASGQVAEIRLFRINISRQPHIGTDVFAPAIKVEIHLRHAGRTVGAVETDNVILVILNPNAAFERSAASLLGHNIKNQAADGAQEFTTDIFEVVRVPVELAADNEHLLE